MLLSTYTRHLADECESKVSQRGVVVFRGQDDADTEILKQVAIRLGELTGRPEGNGLSIHPFFHSAREGLGSDDYINCVSSDDRKKVYKQPKKTQSHNNWHSDLGFEACPGDYSVFLLTEVPETGGGTIKLLTKQRSYWLIFYFLQTHCSLQDAM